MAKYLDDNGLLYFWQKIKNIFATKSSAVSNITRSGTTFTATKADGTTFTFDQQDNTVEKTTTSPKANGTAAIGSETKYAAGDHVHPAQTSVSGNAGSATQLETSRKIDGVGFDGTADIIHYGSSSTSASTATKAVNCTGFSLVTGAQICVKFANTNTATASGLKLNVNSTGAKSIKYRGNNLPSDGILGAGRVYTFVYDGTNYELIGDLDTTTTITAGTATPLMDGTAAVGTSAKYAREDHVHPSDTNKVDKVSGKGLSTNDYTTAEKEKLGALPDNSTLSSTYATKSEITNMYKYKGSVASADSLPSSGQTVGDVYNIEAASAYGGAGMNVAWNGTAWDPLGEIFSITSVTNGEIDTIVAS